MSIRTIVTVVAVALLVIPACGDDADDATGEGPSRIEIELGEFQFDPDLASVAAGQTVEFVVTNNGALEHEFRVTNQAEIDAHIAGGHEEHTEGDDMGDMSEGESDDMPDDTIGESDDMSDDTMGEVGENMLVIPPGETMTLTVTFPEDTTEFTRFVCLIPGHYEAGMVGDIAYSG